MPRVRMYIVTSATRYRAKRTGGAQRRGEYARCGERAVRGRAQEERCQMDVTPGARGYMRERAAVMRGALMRAGAAALMLRGSGMP